MISFLLRGIVMGADKTGREDLSCQSPDLITAGLEMPGLFLHQIEDRRNCLYKRGGISDDAVAQGFGDGFGFGVHLQLAVDISHVKGDRVDAEREFGGRRFVVVAFD